MGSMWWVGRGEDRLLGDRGGLGDGFVGNERAWEEDACDFELLPDPRELKAWKLGGMGKGALSD